MQIAAPEVHQTGEQQVATHTPVAANTLSMLWSAVATWWAARIALMNQRSELAALSPVDARDLGIDAALLRQAASFASSRQWMRH